MKRKESLWRFLEKNLKSETGSSLQIQRLAENVSIANECDIFDLETETDYEFYVVSSDDNGCYNWTFDKAKANKYFRKVKSRGRKKV